MEAAYSCFIMKIINITILAATMLSINTQAREAILGVDSNFNDKVGVQLQIADVQNNIGGFLSYTGNSDSNDGIKAYGAGLNYHFKRVLAYAGYSYETRQKSLSSEVFHMRGPYGGDINSVSNQSKNNKSGAVLGIIYKSGQHIAVGVKYNTTFKSTLLTIGYEL